MSFAPKLLKMKIILAEDNELLRKSLSFFLTSKGFEVDQFSNGSEALEAIKTNDYAMILTDINMPGSSGMEITQFVRVQLGLQTPIIIFTSSNIEQTEVDSFAIGANEFIPKPVSPAVLLIRMNKLINQRS